MAVNKKNIFPENYQRLADFAKALSHPARVAILKTLAGKSCICGEIVQVLPLAQSTVSQHLKELKRAGLITGEIDGPRSCYCLNRDIFAGIAKEFGLFLDEFGDGGDSCACR